MGIVPEIRECPLLDLLEKFIVADSFELVGRIILGDERKFVVLGKIDSEIFPCKETQGYLLEIWKCRASLYMQILPIHIKVKVRNGCPGAGNLIKVQFTYIQIFRKIKYELSICTYPSKDFTDRDIFPVIA